MSKFCSLFSGSKANCTYIESTNGAVMVDMGSTYRATNEALKNIGADFEKINALLITHTHTDHIAGVKVLLKNHNIPVMASKKVLLCLEEKGIIPPGTRLIPIEDESTEFCGFNITRFSTSHDSEGSGGYTVTTPDGVKTAVCTDLGYVSDTVRDAVTGSKILVLEFNHDIKMLQNGPYSPELKLRVASDLGHLSNNAAAAELPSLLKSGTTEFVLGHISQNNNLPSIAQSSAEAALMDLGAKNGVDYKLFAAAPKGNRVIYF